MNVPTLHRLVCLAAAAGTTLALFSSVVAISEPQRSALMALQDKAPAAQTRVAAASAAAGVSRQ